MKKRDYFLKALKYRAFKRNAWVLRCFAISNIREVSEPEYDFELLKDGDALVFKDPESGVFETIEDVPKTRALFHKRESVLVDPGDLPNIKKKIKTSYGNLLFNAMILADIFQDRFDYIEGRIDAVALERKIAKMVSDDPKEDSEKSDDKIYVSDLIKFEDALVNLGGYNKLFVPSATPYTMQASPKALARLEELKKQYAGQLNDPVVIAKIWKEVRELDIEWLESDPDKGFVIKGKTVDVVRKRLYYMFGIEADFAGSGEYTFIERPLDKGTDLKFLPETNNSVRDGSYNRGALTALGGEKFKRIIQSTAGTVVNEDDCGSQVGEFFEMTANNFREYVGHYFIKDKRPVLLTEEMESDVLGKVLEFRSPAYCNTKDGNHCVKCVGEFIRGREDAIPMLASDIGSTMMSINMAAMHGKALKTVKLDLKRIMR